MTIPTLPDPPSTSDPTNFQSKADALIAALPGFVSGANDLGAAMSAMAAGGQWLTEESIASATTTNLAATSSHLILITGTTTITGFGTVAAGAWRMIRFAAALTLTHNATSMILPGGENITTAAGDCMIITSLGSGNWRVRQYQRAAYAVADGGSWTPAPAFATPGNSSWSTSVASGTWRRGHGMVFVRFRLVTTPTIGTGSGNLLIGGLPFAGAAGLGDSGIPTHMDSSAWVWPTNYTELALYLGTTTAIGISANKTGAGTVIIGAAHMTTGASHEVRGSLAYMA